MQVDRERGVDRKLAMLVDQAQGTGGQSYIPDPGSEGSA